MWNRIERLTGQIWRVCNVADRAFDMLIGKSVVSDMRKVVRVIDANITQLQNSDKVNEHQLSVLNDLVEMVYTLNDILEAAVDAYEVDDVLLVDTWRQALNTIRTGLNTVRGDIRKCSGDNKEIDDGICEGQ